MRVRCLFILLFLFLIGMNNVSAMSLIPSGDSLGKKGEQINVYLELKKSNEEKSVSAIEGVLSFDNKKLSLVSVVTVVDKWRELSEVSNNGVFSYANLSFDNLIVNDGQKVIKMVFKVLDTANVGDTIIGVNNTNATDDMGNEIDISGGTHTVKISSSGNLLSKITVNDEEISLEEDVFEYEFITDSDSVLIDAVLSDDSSFVSGYMNPVILKDGINTVIINVTSKLGETVQYKLMITKNKTFGYRFSDKLTVDESLKYVKYLNIGMTVSELLAEVNVLKGDVSIYDINGNKKSNDLMLATGDVLQISNNTDTRYKYSISVIGDVNGDGVCDLIDLVQMRKHIVGYTNPNTGKIQRKDGVYLYALDFNKDNTVDLIDLVRIRKYIVGYNG